MHAQSCPTLCNTWTVACQVPLSVGFPRQDYWSGVPFPTPEHLPDPEIEPMFPALAGKFFTTGPPGKPPGVMELSKYGPCGTDSTAGVLVNSY